MSVGITNAAVVPLRVVQFTVDTLGGVSPPAPQYAGVQGEHNATQLVFDVQAWAAVNAAFLYRLEIVDSLGEYATTDLLSVENEKVQVLLPAAWTVHGGNVLLRLTASQLTNGAEEQLVYSASAWIFFDARDTGSGKLEDYAQQTVTVLLDETQEAALRAQESAQLAAQYVGKSAYAVAVDNGFVGTEQEWLASLKGDTGAKGDTGEAGPNCIDTTTTTSFNGLIKGNGSTTVLAVPATDYVTPDTLNGFLPKSGGDVTGSIYPAIPGTYTVGTSPKPFYEIYSIRGIFTNVMCTNAYVNGYAPWTSNTLPIATNDWTPRLASTGTSPSGTLQYCYAWSYRFGKLCFITFHMKYNITDAGTGYARIGGLPFPSASGCNKQGLAVTECQGGITSNATDTTAYIADSSTYIEIQNNFGSAASTWSTGETWIGFTGCYRIQ